MVYRFNVCIVKFQWGNARNWYTRYRNVMKMMVKQEVVTTSTTVIHLSIMFISTNVLKDIEHPKLKPSILATMVISLWLYFLT